MPLGASPSRAAIHRTLTRRDSRGPSTWSRSARSTTPTPEGRHRCRALPLLFHRPTPAAVAELGRRRPRVGCWRVGCCRVAIHRLALSGSSAPHRPHSPTSDDQPQKSPGEGFTRIAVPQFLNRDGQDADCKSDCDPPHPPRAFPRRPAFFALAAARVHPCLHSPDPASGEVQDRKDDDDDADEYHTRHDPEECRIAKCSDHWVLTPIYRPAGWPT